MTRYMPKGITKKQMGGIKRPKFLLKFPKFRKPNIQKLRTLFTRGNTKKGAVASSSTRVPPQLPSNKYDSNITLPPLPSRNSSNDQLPSIPLKCDSQDKAFNDIINKINTTEQYKYINSNLGNKKLEDIPHDTLTAAYKLIGEEYNIIKLKNAIISFYSDQHDKSKNIYRNKNRYNDIKPNLNTMVVLQKKVTLPHTYSHIHYTAWPDHGVPETTIDGTYKYYYEALNKIIAQLFTYKTEHNNNINVLVHCSAGVGRTGTFIMMCYLYYEIIIKKKKNIDKNDIIRAILLMRILRNQAMVQTLDQLKYIMGYCDHLLEITLQEESKPKTSERITIENKVNAQRVIAEIDIDSSYINANYINKNCSNIDYPFAFFNKIIAAQGPLSTTIDDFNKMIAQEGITHVIMVTNLVENSSNKCAKYFTEENETSLTANKYNNMLGANTSNDDNYTIRGGTITFKEQEQTLPPPVDRLQKTDELKAALSQILKKSTQKDTNGVLTFLTLLKAEVNTILASYNQKNNTLLKDPYCIKIKLRRGYEITFYIINKRTGYICPYKYIIPNADDMQSYKENHNTWVNWLMKDINNNKTTVEFYLHGKMIDGDQIVKKAEHNTSIGINLPNNIQYRRNCKIIPTPSYGTVAFGGARKYRSKKANKNKRCKTSKTKKLRGGWGAD